MRQTIYTKEELKKYCPAAFTTCPAEHVSDRYAYVNTEMVLDKALSMGLVPVKYFNARPIKRDFRFTEHMITLQDPASLKDKYDVDDVKAQISIWNSHDAKSSIRIIVGLFRCVCANQMFSAIGEIQRLNIRHVGSPEKIEQSINYALTKGLEQATMLTSRVATFKQRLLVPSEAMEMADAAVELRWPGIHTQKPQEASIKAVQLLQVRRNEDEHMDAWTVFNRLQENLIRGQRGYRRVIGLSSQVELNQKLWTLLEQTVAQAA